MMKNLIQKVLTASSIIALTACGGGGGGGGDTDAGDSQPQSGNVGSNTSAKFSVSLSNIDIRRVSNGDEVPIDTSSIQSGELTLTQSR